MRRLLELLHSPGAVFELVKAGKLGVSIGQARALSEIVEVHKGFEAGDTIGSTLLSPR
jgi:hypothetical protein